MAAYLNSKINIFKLKQIIFYSLGITLFTIAAFRKIGTDADSLNYQSLFNNYENLNLIKIEPTFLFFSWIIHNFLFSNVNLLLIIYAAFGVSLNILAIKSLSPFWLLSLFVYFTHFFFLHEMTQIRAGVASGLLLLSLKFIYEQQLKKFVLLSTLAFLFHYSAIVIFPLYFLNTKKIKPLLIFCLIITAYCLNFFNTNFIRLIEMIPIASLQYKISFHRQLVAISSSYDQIKVFNVFQILHLFYISIFLWKAEILQEKNPYSILLIKLYAISICFLVIFSDIPTLAFRLSELIGIIEIILIPFLLYIFKPKIFPILLILILQSVVLYINLFHSRLIVL